MPINNVHLPGTSYKKTIEYLYGLNRFGVKLGLTSISALLTLLDNPHEAFHVLHVGGSNGKGSTAAMTASLLIRAGYRVGLYTSPHLVRFNERIRVGGREIPNRKVVELSRKIASVLAKDGENLPSTFFEFTTAMAFLYFAESAVDIAVVEVGMGGRLDATNVVRPLVSIITNVSRDHEKVLGSGIRAVAREKAGIIKRGVPLVTAARGAALQVVEEVSQKVEAPLYRYGREFSVTASDEGDFSFVAGEDGAITGLRSALMGRHQYLNAACAIMAATLMKEKGYAVGERAVRGGLAAVRWPARMEVLRREPTVLVDCAHNPDGADALKNALAPFLYKRLFLIIGVMADKDIKSITAKLVPLADSVIVTRAASDRAAAVDMLAQAVRPYGKPVEVVEEVPRACGAALSMAAPDDLICIAGSVYVAGEARVFMARKEVTA